MEHLSKRKAMISGIAAIALIGTSAAFFGMGRSADTAEAVDAYQVAQVATVITEPEADTAEVEEIAAAARNNEEDEVYAALEIKYITETEEKVIDYGTVYHKSEKLPEGEERILSAGQQGILTISTIKTIVDGEEVSTRQSSEITRKPVNEVVLLGAMDDKKRVAAKPSLTEAVTFEDITAIADEDEQGDDIQPLTASGRSDAEQVNPNAPAQISRFAVPDDVEFDENGVPTEYKEALTGRACAYTANPGALMSTGKSVYQGYVAVDPDLIPYGSELYIVADDGTVYGYAIAGDTGYSVRVGDIVVDLFMDEYNDCINWGNRHVTVYVLE